MVVMVKLFLLVTLCFLNPCEIDGREFRKSSRDRFAFSGVSASTDIVYFDDASPEFDLKRLYSKVTGSFEVAVSIEIPSHPRC